ncbi:MAG: 16S rRNA (guanine(527)-N(7))-methyltransferase RsmG [Planctomycetaceae bacterium]|nr:16S rRNA (guanine(527)-N(7))-methyltransferase RsmG [Planctomycetaceae bacterium]
MSDAAELAAAIERHHVTVDTQYVEPLAAYCERLWHWNTLHNLTRHTDFDLFVTRDLVDTLRLSAQIAEGQRVLDIGSGGGVPGLVLSILRPDLKVSMAESVTKKSAVLLSMIQSMQLAAGVYPDRAENVLKRRRFDVVTARAVASLSRILTWLSPVSRSWQELLLIKGPRWTEEQAEASELGLLRNVTISIADSWPTKGRDGESVLLRIRTKTGPPPTDG